MLHFLHFSRTKYLTLAIAVIALQLLTGKASGQTDPTPQALPFSQSFTSLTGGITTYPAGFQGWSVPGGLSTTVLTAAPTGDLVFSAGLNNATTSPFVGDMVGKIGILSNSVTVTSLCLAINTTGVTGVEVIYAAATQGQTVGGPIDELDLQCRVGTSGTFTTVVGATYQNNALANTNTAVTTASSPASTYVVLPASCNNQGVVELRWIARNVSGSGANHPGFSILNVAVQTSAGVTDFYSAATGNLDATATWGTNTDGTGSNPSNFTAAGQVFHISNGNAGGLTGNWTVSGSGSKVVVDGTDFTISTHTLNGTIDVNAGRTLTIANTTLPTFGIISMLSTVMYSGMTIPATAYTPVYGSFIADNSTFTNPGSTTPLNFAGNFTLQNGASVNCSKLTLATIGPLDQVINGNGLGFSIRNLDNATQNPTKTGQLLLRQNTPITMQNSLIMTNFGAANAFSDSGNTLTVINNASIDGNAAGYNLTGTMVFAGTSGTTNVRGNAAGNTTPVSQFYNLTVAGTGSNTVAFNTPGGTPVITIKNNFTITTAGSGGVVLNLNTIQIGGNLVCTPTVNVFNVTNSTVEFNGTGAQTYSSNFAGGITYNNIKMSNTGSGLTLSSPLGVSGVLTLNTGNIITGANTLSITSTGGVSGGSTSSYVNGNLSQVIPTGSALAKTYEVGDNTYAPTTITFPGTVSASGSLTVKSTTGAHPQIATSYINTANYAGRYWTLTNSGVALSSGAVNVALSYNSGDVTGGGTNAGFIIREYTGSAWVTSPSETNTTTATPPLQPYASTTTGTALATLSGDYVAGAPDCTPTPGTTTSAPAFLCGSGTATLTLTGATTNTGNTYQWQSSPDGSAWTPISGATNSTYTTPTISTSTYYMATVGCIPTTTTANSVPATVTVNPVVSAIMGTDNVCQLASVTLSDPDGGGTWSSSNPAVGTVGTSGAVAGVAGGTTTITYTLPTGCTATYAVTVNPLPAPGPITGFATTYIGSTTTLSDAITGGTWTSANTAVATISSTGTVSGIAAGSAIISYTMNNACGNTSVTTNVTVSAPFAQGNLVVQAVNNAGSSASKAINIIQYTTSGTLVSSNLLPYSGASRITMSGNATSEGFLTLSLERDQLVIVGYDSDTGTSAVSGSNATTVNRVIGAINQTGAFTRLFARSVFSSGSVRGGVSYGGNYYASGANTGVVLMNTPTTIAGTTFTNCRDLQIFNGNMYVSASTGSFKGVSQVGSGIPVTTGQTESLLASESSAGGPYGFSISPDGNTMYVASATSGILKYTRTGGTGVFTPAAYTVYAGAACSGIAVDYSTTNPTIYATLSSGLSLIKLQDAGVAVTTPTTLATTSVSNPFRGVMFAPAAYATVSGATAICSGNSTNISFAGNPHGIVTYNINGGTNQTVTLDSATAQATVNTGVLTAGTYTVSLVSVAVPSGTYTISGNVVVTVNALPVVTATVTPNPICAGATLALNATPGSGSGTYTTYAWAGPNSFAATTQSASIAGVTSLAAGTYTISVTDNNNCTGSVVTSPVTVNALPAVSASITPNPICVNNTLSMNATPAGGSGTYSSYSWSGPNTFAASTQTASIPSITTAGAGAYTVSVTDNNGCTSPSFVTSAVTVNVLPTITATVTPNPLCAGTTLILNSTPAGGSGTYSSYSWTGPNSFSATTRNVSILSIATAGAGAYSVSVTDNNGCTSGSYVTSSVTVNTLPTITAAATPNPICVNGTLSLNATPAGGSGTYSSYSWSGPNAFSATTQSASISSITTASAGAYTVSVTDNNGCGSSSFVTASVTVNSLPTITATVIPNPICVNSTLSLNATPAGGSGTYSNYSWIGPNSFSATTRNATIPSITTSGAGTYTVSVIDNNGCRSASFVTSFVTVNVLPTITATVTPNLICAGTTLTLNSTPAGGSGTYSNYSWSGPNSFSATTRNASVSSITTAGAGAYTVSVTDNNGCASGSFVTSSVTVNVLPTITATVTPNPLCVNSTLSLNATPAGGSGTYSSYLWNGPNTFSATTQSASISSITTAGAGAYTVSVTDNNGCTSGSFVTSSVTVNTLPTITAIVTPNPICVNSTLSLNATPAGGSGTYSSYSWIGPNGFSATTRNATIPSITTAGAGTYTVSVTDNSGCGSASFVTSSVTVNVLPTITATVTPNPLCAGATLTLNATPAGGSGTYSSYSWSGPNTFSATTQNASVPSITTSGAGAYTVSVTDNNGCTSGSFVTSFVTVNVLPTITATVTPNPLCVNSTLSLNATPAGGSGTYSSYLWNGPNTFSATTQNATIPSITTAGAGAYTVSVTDNNGCGSASFVTSFVTVNVLPTITATVTPNPICVSNTLSLNATPASGSGTYSNFTWTGPNTFSATTQNASVSSITSAGAGAYTVSVIDNNGCSSAQVVTGIVTVNPLPDAILGTDVVSVGFTITLSDDGGGTWSSSNGNVSVDGSGNVTGEFGGTSTVTYTLGTGCSTTTIVTVNTTLPVINGNLSVCELSTTALTDAGGDGTWSSGNGNVTVGSSSGIVTGVTAGTSVITYTFPSTDIVTAIVTVNPLPTPILGTAAVCVGLTTTLTDATAGGTWSSSNAHGTLGTAGGLVTGSTPGIDTISYILSTGCMITKPVTVNAVPLSISGNANVCAGSATSFSDVTSGGTWSSSNANATVGTAGLVNGVTAGTAAISYALGTGCASVMIVTVNPLPGIISGATNVCAGSEITLTDAGGGSWSNTGGNASVDGSGDVSGLIAGTSVITYTLPVTGCRTTMVITVNAIVVPGIGISSASGDTVCSGTTVLFTATPANGGSLPAYQWTVNSGTITGATNSTYNYLPSNGDIVKVTLTSNAACAVPAIATAADTIAVIPTYTTSVSISVTPNDTVCMGSDVLFTAAGVNGGTSPVYIWSRNGADVFTGPVYGLIPGNNDNIYCRLVSSLRCKTADTIASNHIVMSVDTAYIPSVVVIASQGTMLHMYEADTFRAVVTNAGPVVTYQWVLNSTVIAGATNDIYYGGNFSDNDSITCVVTSAGPCGYASFNTVTIHIYRVGVQHVAAGSDIRLVPNPNKGQFTIKGSLGSVNDEEVSIEITDMLGQVVYKNKGMVHNGNINEAISLSHTLANGMYMLNLHSGDERQVFHFVMEQ